MDQNKLSTAGSRVDLMAHLASTDAATSKLRLEIYRRYADIAKWKFSEPAIEAVIRGNIETFKAIISPVLVAVMVSKRDTYSEYATASGETPDLSKLFTNGSELSSTIKAIEKIIGEPIQNPSYLEVVSRVRKFNPGSSIPSMDNMEDLDEEPLYFDDEDEEDYDEPEVDELGASEPEINTEHKIVDEEDELSLDHRAEVVSNTNRILSVYRDLFEVGFDLIKPYGILIKEGILAMNGDLSVVRKLNAASKIYDVISEAAGGSLVQSRVLGGVKSTDLRSIKIQKGTNYYPLFQLANIIGIIADGVCDSWEQFRSKLTPIIEEILISQIKQGNDVSSIVEALTTCIIVSEYDPAVNLRLRINVGYGEASIQKIISLYEKNKREIFAGTGEVYRQNTTSTGVAEITLVFSMEAYNKRPLFAYEAVSVLQARGKSPSIQNVILGQDLDGKIFTKNFDRQNASIILIGAGPRSGKGVLTLNILGTILASGCPVVYCDCKPDMSKMLWGLTGRKNINGIIIDAMDSNGRAVGIGAPASIAEKSPELFGFLAYFKVVQLMILAANLRTKGIQVGGKTRPFFIFDEIYAIQQRMLGVWPSISVPARDTKNTSEEAEWARVVGMWVEQLCATLGSTVNSQLPMSGVSTMWLFQSIQPKDWNDLALKSVTNNTSFSTFIDVLKSRTSVKIYGKGSTDSIYGLNGRKILENIDVIKTVINKDGRGFAYSEDQKILDMGQIKLFKPYLVLNECENGSIPVKELRGNIDDEAWNKIAPSGELDPRAGFEGFSMMLGEQAMQNIQKGRDLIEEIMQECGLTQYGSIEEYLYDASAESFQSVGELLNYRGGSGDKKAEEPQEEADEEIDFSSFGREPNREVTTPKVTQTGNTNVTTGVAPKKESRVPEVFGREYELSSLLDAENMEYNDDFNEPEPITIEKRNTPIFDIQMGNSRRVVTDVSNSTSHMRLTRDNCIDCRSASPGPANWIENIYLKTPKGAEKYIQKIWNNILKTVANSGLRPAFITKVSMFGNNLYINGKIANLNGVIGGYEAITLRDIVSYRILLKRYFMIKEIRLDEDMFRAAIAELGDETVEKIFGMATKLERLYVLTEDQSVVSFDRASVNESKAKKIEAKGKNSNNLDLTFKNNSKKTWDASNPSSNIWGLKLAKGAMGNAGAALMDRNKPSLGRAIGYTLIGATAATLGATAWGITTGIRKVFGVFRQ